ncbi:MAG: UDP-N-acetylglucosamine 1-carboxyvinyltransferase [Calditrichaeota bacterium]|nr:UDP-N-acetylglucosamine 1-carboxyvinyltransferase [Calditrichota bacterium]
MYKFVINGGRTLHGRVPVSGSKNATLPLMAATLLARGKYVITNIPLLRDVTTMKQLLEIIGVSVEFENHRMVLDSSHYDKLEAPYDLVKKMRASIYVLGPLLAKNGYAKVSLPGGCAWGPRPVNFHIESLRKMGAAIDLENGYIVARAKRLKGAVIAFDFPSVGATGNAMMAAALAKGTTVIQNAAMEPEITNLGEFLNAMGAKISGLGTNHLEIEGVDELHPADGTVIPDRIEAGTFLIAGAITGGEITVEKAEAKHLTAILSKLGDTGARISADESSITLRAGKIIRSVNVSTAVYPGFPTDMQAQWMALMCVADKTSVITDTVYLDRFAHVPELMRLGANITLDGNVAAVTGVKKLTGATVMSTDLRASASLILAGLVAEGKTEVLRIYHIDRGYEAIEKKLQALGADIQRVRTEEF